MITTPEIQALLKKAFPNLKDWNPTDPIYARTTLAEIQQFLDQFPQPAWKQYKWECEEIAKGLMMDVRRWEYNDVKELNRAIGVANLTRVRGQEMGHTVNIAITDTILLFDAATKVIWEAERGRDNVYFVEM
jgi:hypothetical protein